MLAVCGWNNALKIFDKRESKIVQTIDCNHTGNIFYFV